MSITVGIWAGILGATRRGSFIDGMISLFANVGNGSTHLFVRHLGIYVLGLKLDLLPIQGFTWPSVNLWKSLRTIRNTYPGFLSGRAGYRHASSPDQIEYVGNPSTGLYPYSLC